MIIVGLLGGIAVGKTTLAMYLKRFFRARVFSADDTVHDLYKNNCKLISMVAAFCPASVVVSGIVDRQILGRYIAQNPHKLGDLERIVYPFVFAVMCGFIKQQRREHCRLVVLDIPKLEAIGAHKYCDAIIRVVSCPVLQRIRLDRRLGAEHQRVFLKNGHKGFVRGIPIFTVKNSLSRSFLVMMVTKIMSSILNRVCEPSCIFS